MADLDPSAARPTWRKPIGVIALLIALGAYAGVIAWAAAPIAQWPALVQAPIYVVLGTIWLLPLQRYLIWMETGRWG